MNNLSRITIASLLMVVLFFPISLAVADHKGESVGKTLVISKISSNPKKHYRYLKPIADYVVSKMDDLGYVDAQVMMAKNLRQMTSYMRRGKVDWVTETPFVSAALHRRAGAQFLLRKWKKGVPDYHSVFFTRSDSGISSLENLKGKVIAFQDRGSSSAFYIPAYLMISNDLKLVEMHSFRDKPEEDEIGYIFAGEEINMSTWVHKGIVAAGAYSNLDWEKDDHTPPAFRKDFVLFERSNKFPRAIELVREDLPEQVKQRIKQVLLSMNDDPDVRNILKSYQKTKKFDELTKEMLTELETIEQIVRLVDEAIN